VGRWRMMMVVMAWIAFGREGNPAHISPCLSGDRAHGGEFRSRNAVGGAV
jgi:hypothetical protein